MHQVSKLRWILVAGVVLAGCKKTVPFDPHAVRVGGISPLSGPKNCTVEIFGNHFSDTLENNLVFFNGHPATVTGATANRLTVVVPAKAGTGPVEVRVGNESAKGPVFDYQYDYYTVTTLAGSETTGFAEGRGASASMGILGGIGLDKDGNAFAADFSNNVVWKVSNDGNATVIAGTGSAGYLDGPARKAQFDGPNGLAVDKNSVIYVSDFRNQNIRKLQSTGGAYNVITLAGSKAKEKGWMDGSSTQARFNQPDGLALDNNGHLFVSDAGNAIIRKITASTGEVATLAGTGVRGSANGSVSSSSFYQLEGLAVSAGGNYLLAADAYNGNVRKVMPLNSSDAAFVTTEIGPADHGADLKDGSYGVARFSYPTGVAIDEAHGHVFITDANNRCIRMADMKTRTVKTLVGDPSKVKVTGSGSNQQYFYIVDGDLGSALLNYPEGIAVDKDGNIFFTDSGCVRMIAYE